MRPAGDNKKAASTPPGRGQFALVVALAALSGGAVAFWFRGAPTWVLIAGAIGLVASVVLVYLLTRSMERRLWAGFFTFLAGAAASLSAPVFSFDIAGNINGGAGGAEAIGAISSGGSAWGTLIWLLGAVICGLFALSYRR